jgi:hypothetical protein
VTGFNLRQGVAQYESLLKNGKGNNLQVPWPADFVAHFGKGIYRYMNCLSASMVIPNPVIVGLLDTVRNKVLSFALELETEAPDAGEGLMDAEPLPERVVGHVFNNYILGGSNTIAAGSSHFTQNTTISVRQGDLNSPSDYLKGTGLTENDLTELESAISQDEVPQDPKKLGGRVSGWIGKMVSKAASGTWDIAVSSAADLLTKAILIYYGYNS